MRRPVLTILAAAIGVAGFTACDSERAIATDPIGAPAYGMRLSNAATNLPRGTATIVQPTALPPLTPAPDTIRITLAGLDSIETGAWVLWASDTVGTTWRRLTGTLRVVRTDTVTNEFGDPEAVSFSFTRTGVSSFQEGGPSNAMTFTTTRAQSGIPAGEQIGVLLLSYEADPAAATQPSTTARPLWFRRPTATINATSTGALSFGYFSFDPAERYVYTSGTQRGRVYTRGDVMLVNDSSLARPPRGFYYASYAIKRDSTSAAFDTLYLGAQTAPAPRRNLSLRNADVEIVDPLVQLSTPPQILAASNRVEAGSIEGIPQVTGNPFREIAQVLVVLELKAGKPEGRLGPNYILLANLPTVVRNR